ncbi:hypothetical protein LOY42_18920 [Pseudomonas sp. B21-023]|uniref:hypothetical protein n=1 Tax=Pseudomonas sp. B21-023 TaxID=2895477 RepID=UPI002160ACF5|nr:hypothetical protein [Pseudomonas sp. B21-023]UVM15333.1 hypothetical protein LOY42_18920 [Pseudomonas sp. B21-023]
MAVIGKLNCIGTMNIELSSMSSALTTRLARSACPSSGNRPCEHIQVKVGTFPYVYANANANGAVITVTNYGDALLFRRGKWCRMSMENDVYACARPASSR